MRRANGTNISPNHLVYRWTVEVKKGENIKEGGGNKKGGMEKRREEIR